MIKLLKQSFYLCPDGGVVLRLPQEQKILGSNTRQGVRF
jgi:hypothetical protein